MAGITYGDKGSPYSVFIAGIKYSSLFAAAEANSEGEKRAFWQTSLSLALKRSGGGPCVVKRNVVVLEKWVSDRLEYITKNGL